MTLRFPQKGIGQGSCDFRQGSRPLPGPYLSEPLHGAAWSGLDLEVIDVWASLTGLVVNAWGCRWFCLVDRRLVIAIRSMQLGLPFSQLSHSISILSHVISDYLGEFHRNLSPTEVAIDTILTFGCNIGRDQLQVVSNAIGCVLVMLAA